MGRPVMLSNGSLMVGLNEQGAVHDFYYPYIGLDNLTNARSLDHKIGVWVNGVFSWVDDGTWKTDVSFETDALISSVQMYSEQLGISLHFQDFVDSEFNAFCRMIKVKNQAKEHREVRLFMHQVFQISRAGRADTGLFVPEENYILDYKGRCCLLIYGQHHRGNVYDQFAIGNYGIEGKEGTFRDAEDGELSGSPVEHGGVDSVIRFVVALDSEVEESIEYWIVAADSQYRAEKVHHVLKDDGLQRRLEMTRNYWQAWLETAKDTLSSIDQQYLDVSKKSLLLIKAHIDKRGGIIASGDSSIYNYGRDYYSYVWPRDGAYAIWPLIRMGYKDEPKKFFEFCRDILTDEGFLMHKYQPDKAIGSTWHPLLHGRRIELAIQEDETAIVIYMLGEYYRHSEDQDFVHSLYETFIQPAAEFMSTFIDKETNLPHASYDLWEEKFLTSTYTTAVVYQALLVAAEFAELFDYPDDAIDWREAAQSIFEHAHTLYDKTSEVYQKGFLLKPDGSLQYDKTIDVSSMYGAMMFGLSDHYDMLHSTAHAVQTKLLNQSPSGGCPRYEDDHYFQSDPPFKGNPWFVTTLWLAQYYIRSKQDDDAKELIGWALKHSHASGALSEQVNPSSGEPLSVMPLVWSHAELVNTILDLAHLN